jgi:hypothetical protein
VSSALLFSASLLIGAASESDEPVNKVKEPFKPGSAVGVTLGEATALTYEYRTSEVLRVVARVGMQHSAQPFSATLDDVMFGVGIERDVLSLSPSTHLTVGLGIDSWVRSNYLRLRPMLALELPIGLRIAGPKSTIAWRLAVVPRSSVLPGVHPHVGGFVGLAFALPEGRKRRLPRGARARIAREEAAAKAAEEAKQKKAEKKKPKAKPQRRGKRK